MPAELDSGRMPAAEVAVEDDLSKNLLQRVRVHGRAVPGNLRPHRVLDLFRVDVVRGSFRQGGLGVRDRLDRHLINQRLQGGGDQRCVVVNDAKVVLVCGDLVRGVAPAFGQRVTFWVGIVLRVWQVCEDAKTVVVDSFDQLRTLDHFGAGGIVETLPGDLVDCGEGEVTPHPASLAGFGEAGECAHLRLDQLVVRLVDLDEVRTADPRRCCDARTHPTTGGGRCTLGLRQRCRRCHNTSTRDRVLQLGPFRLVRVERCPGEHGTAWCFHRDNTRRPIERGQRQRGRLHRGSRLRVDRTRDGVHGRERCESGLAGDDPARHGPFVVDREAVEFLTHFVRGNCTMLDTLRPCLYVGETIFLVATRVQLHLHRQAKIQLQVTVDNALHPQNPRERVHPELNIGLSFPVRTVHISDNPNVLRDDTERGSRTRHEILGELLIESLRACLGDLRPVRDRDQLVKDRLITQRDRVPVVLPLRHLIRGRQVRGHVDETTRDRPVSEHLQEMPLKLQVRVRGEEHGLDRGEPVRGITLRPVAVVGNVLRREPHIR